MAEAESVQTESQCGWQCEVRATGVLGRTVRLWLRRFHHEKWGHHGGAAGGECGQGGVGGDSSRPWSQRRGRCQWCHWVHPRPTGLRWSCDSTRRLCSEIRSNYSPLNTEPGPRPDEVSPHFASSAPSHRLGLRAFPESLSWETLLRDQFWVQLQTYQRHSGGDKINMFYLFVGRSHAGSLWTHAENPGVFRETAYSGEMLALGLIKNIFLDVQFK